MEKRPRTHLYCQVIEDASSEVDADFMGKLPGTSFFRLFSPFYSGKKDSKNVGRRPPFLRVW